MIDIRQMRYFVTLADTLHFSRAAERLHISQPPLTRQIAALERELGVRLLDRQSRRAALTAAGRRFHDDARAVLKLFDQTCENARRTQRGELGELSIGFMMHAAYTVLPGLVKRYLARYPDVDVKLREVIPGALSGDVQNGKYDAAIMFSPGPAAGLDQRTIHREQLYLAVHENHPMARNRIVRASQLAGEPMIASPVEAAPMLREAIAQYCRAAGVEPTIRLEVQLQQTIVSLVAENLGVALVPRSMEKLGTRGVAFVKIESAPVIDYVIAWRTASENPALRSFVELSTPKGKL